MQRVTWAHQLLGWVGAAAISKILAKVSLAPFDSIME